MRRGRHSASQREAGRRDALPFMVVTELTSQLDRSELKEEASRNTEREGRVRQKLACSQAGREATAPCFMLVTLLTSHRDRSLLKSEHA